MALSRALSFLQIYIIWCKIDFWSTHWFFKEQHLRSSCFITPQKVPNSSTMTICSKQEKTTRFQQPDTDTVLFEFTWPLKSKKLIHVCKAWVVGVPGFLHKNDGLPILKLYDKLCQDDLNFQTYIVSIGRLYIYLYMNASFMVNADTVQKNTHGSNAFLLVIFAALKNGWNFNANTFWASKGDLHYSSPWP